MRTLIYLGPVGLRRIGKADGLNVDREFEMGVPTEVSDEDADLILSGPQAHEFTEDAEPSSGDAHPNKED